MDGDLIQTEIDPLVKARLEEIEQKLREQAGEIARVEGAAVGAVKLASDAMRLSCKTPGGGGSTAVRNVALLIGLSALGTGCWWLEPAAALIVVGGLLLTAPVIGSIARIRKGSHDRFSR